MQESQVQHATERMSELRDNLTERIDGHAMQEKGQHALERAEGLPSGLYIGGVLGSIALSALLFIRGRRALALFVGLWPPTIVSLALAMKQLRPSEELSHQAA